MNFVDYKFILIPVLFVLLRMWTCIRTIITEYAGVNLLEKAPVVHTFLVYLSVSDKISTALYETESYNPFKLSVL